MDRLQDLLNNIRYRIDRLRDLRKPVDVELYDELEKARNALLKLEAKLAKRQHSVEHELLAPPRRRFSFTG